VITRVTRETFAKALLYELKAPATQRNLWALVAWMQAEGSTASFNPLATTQEMPGATDFNSVGVKNYVSFKQGVEATAKTLNHGADLDIYGYRPIRTRLRQNTWAKRTLRAVEKSIWGTGGLALRCLPGVKQHWIYYRDLPIGQ
jgi:hypothetical protein